METATLEPAAIARYLLQLKRFLRPLPVEDREDIAAEIRSHLLLRAEVIGAEQAIAEFGPPERCAQGFLEELRLQSAFADGSPGASLSALSSVAARSLVGAGSFCLAACFFLIAIGFAALVPLELIYPDAVGVWKNAAGEYVAYGFVDAQSRAGLREIIGHTIIHMNLLFACAFFLVASASSRIGLKLLLQRSRTRRAALLG
ncbi:MAG: hypothetical protein K2P95_08855 [Hyphomonadaceae bacterium]|nr:hypothetical protein [Hyphomonadaceae bacterium]